jgi:aspartate/methionine/tyrosine aminotransferase
LIPDTRSLTPDSPAVARDAVRALRASRIREIANAGMDDPEVLAFWFGEPDQVTPEFIRDAATASLAKGETF